MAVTGNDQCRPSAELATITRELLGSRVSVDASQTERAASYVTTGSEAACSGPGGVDATVTPGSAPRCHVRPESRETAKPMFVAPPRPKRPSW
ncbi:MAG: hypothetical protein ACRDL2_11610 [Gaiellaceae bacterium]